MKLLIEVQSRDLKEQMYRDCIVFYINNCEMFTEIYKIRSSNANYKPLFSPAVA